MHASGMEYPDTREAIQKIRGCRCIPETMIPCLVEPGKTLNHFYPIHMNQKE
jgi:hypothetical protein